MTGCGLSCYSTHNWARVGEKRCIHTFPKFICALVDVKNPTEIRTLLSDFSFRANIHYTIAHTQSQWTQWIKGKKMSFILQDNARPHTEWITQENSLELGWSILPNPPFSSGPAPTYYHLFQLLKNASIFSPESMLHIYHSLSRMVWWPCYIFRDFW